jgi:AAA+ ATPase superfamily predicted ATPase
MRKYEEMNYISFKDFILDLQKEINSLTKKFPSLIDFLKRIEGVSILGNEVKLHWGRGNRVKFSSLLELLDEWADDKVIVALDEAQELINLRGTNLLFSFSYSFDNLRKVKIILTSSKMGLLYRYLKIDDPDSPLHGRAMNRVELNPFDREKSKEFLERGFKEVGISFNEYDKIYEELGGVPGWQTYFGYYYQSRDYDKALELTLHTAEKLIRKEFENFLKSRMIAKKRYITQ